MIEPPGQVPLEVLAAETSNIGEGSLTWLGVGVEAPGLVDLVP